MPTNKRVAILVHDGYQDLQFWYPLLRLREEGVPVTVVSVEPEKTYLSQLEYPVIPDQGIAQVQAKDFGALIVPGGVRGSKKRIPTRRLLMTLGEELRRKYALNNFKAKR